MESIGFLRVSFCAQSRAIAVVWVLRLRKAVSSATLLGCFTGSEALHLLNLLTEEDSQAIASAFINGLLQGVYSFFEALSLCK